LALYQLLRASSAQSSAVASSIACWLASSGSVAASPAILAMPSLAARGRLALPIASASALRRAMRARLCSPASARIGSIALQSPIACGFC